MNVFMIASLEETTLSTRKKYQKVYCRLKLLSRSRSIRRSRLRLSRPFARRSDNTYYIINIPLRLYIL